MTRRHFIKMLGGAAAWPLMARSQQSTMPVVGYLSSSSETGETGVVGAIREGLATGGFVDGRNLAIVYRWSGGDYHRLPGLAAELVDRKVKAIIASGLPAALAAKGATTTIPVVFRLAIDPVAFNLVQSLNRPGGNLTGVTTLFDPLTPKKLQLLHELVPGAAAIGFLINPNNANAESHRERAEAAARVLGLHLAVLTAGSAADIEPAFATGRRQGIGALLLGDDPFFATQREELVGAAARHTVPTMYYVRDYVAAGGLISYGPNFEGMARQAGGYAAQILKGAKPAELPVVQPTKFELVINRKTAKALGLTVPLSLLTRADEVIE